MLLLCAAVHTIFLLPPWRKLSRYYFVGMWSSHGILAWYFYLRASWCISRIVYGWLLFQCCFGIPWFYGMWYLAYDLPSWLHFLLFDGVLILFRFGGKRRSHPSIDALFVTYRRRDIRHQEKGMNIVVVIIIIIIITIIKHENVLVDCNSYLPLFLSSGVMIHRCFVGTNSKNCFSWRQEDRSHSFFLSCSCRFLALWGEERSDFYHLLLSPFSLPYSMMIDDDDNI